MSDHNPDDGSRKAKNIAAVLYLLMLTFLVGGSYINQHGADAKADAPASTVNP